MKVKELADKLYFMLEADKFDDISLNGLQIASSDKEAKRVAFAVDAKLDTIYEAAEKGADMLVVHHGLFWGKPIAVVNEHYNRVKKALDADMALFAMHLPLDAHPLFGNNSQMALALGMTSYDPFGEYHGNKIGYKGKLPFPMSCAEVARLLGFDYENGLRILSFGKDMVESVGIISGGAAWDVVDAIKEGLDLYITGEACHEIFPIVKENNMNMIAGGHYKSEVFGVKALMRYVEKEYGIETFFIDSPSGL